MAQPPHTLKGVKRVSRPAGGRQQAPTREPSAVDPFSDFQTIQPDRSGYIPDPQDFAAWMQHPTTRFVARAFEVLAAEQRAEWVRKTWDAGGDPDPLLHKELTTRADAFRALYEGRYEDFVMWVTKGKT